MIIQAVYGNGTETAKKIKMKMLKKLCGKYDKWSLWNIRWQNLSYCISSGYLCAWMETYCVLYIHVLSTWRAFLLQCIIHKVHYVFFLCSYVSFKLYQLIKSGMTCTWKVTRAIPMPEVVELLWVLELGSC